MNMSDKLQDELDAMMRAMGARPLRELEADNSRLAAELGTLKEAIAEHHRQKADDRCIEDDDRLYASAGLPPCDRRVGDKDAMLANCARFIDRRCEGGKWPSYAELESELAAAVAERDELREALVPIVLWERRRCRKNDVPMLSIYERAAALLAARASAGKGVGE